MKPAVTTIYMWRETKYNDYLKVLKCTFAWNVAIIISITSLLTCLTWNWCWCSKDERKWASPVHFSRLGCDVGTFKFHMWKFVFTCDESQWLQKKSSSHMTWLFISHFLNYQWNSQSLVKICTSHAEGQIYCAMFGFQMCWWMFLFLRERQSHVKMSSSHVTICQSF